MDGGAPMTPTIARQVIRMVTLQEKSPTPDANLYNLSKRELEILTCLAQGNSYKMVAELCNITHATVNTHVKNIYEKLQVHSVSGAIEKASKHNLI